MKPRVFHNDAGEDNSEWESGFDEHKTIHDNMVDAMRWAERDISNADVRLYLNRDEELELNITMADGRLVLGLMLEELLAEAALEYVAEGRYLKPERDRLPEICAKLKRLFKVTLRRFRYVECEDATP